MNPEPYHFLFRESGEPLVEELIEMREVLEDLPRTKETIRPTLHLDRGTVWQFQNNPYLLFFAGTWRLPEWFTGGGCGRKQRFINPNAPGIERYTLAGAECACGNVITDIGTNTPVELQHGDGCTPDDRRAVREQVRDIYMHRVVAGAHMNQDAEDITPSIGLSTRSLQNILRANGLEWSPLREIGRRRMAVTIDVLRDEGYTLEEIGTAFDRPVSTIHEYSSRRVFESRQEQAAV